MPLELEAVVVGLEASIQRAMNIAGKNAKIDLGTSSKAIDSLSQPLGRITGQADQFGKSMEAANARVLAFGASVGILGTITRGFQEMISVTIQVEKSLANINSVMGASSAQLNKFKNDIFSIAKETGNSFQTVSEAALELSRQGLKSDEVLRRLKDSMVLSRLSGMDAANAVEGLTAAVNSFSKSGITTTEVLNKIAKTAAAYSVSEKDLIEGFKRSASVAQQAGVSLDELGGIITAVQEKTARGGAVIGNAFKTIFTRIQRPDSLAALEEVGAAVTDMQGGILPATKLIENLAQKMNSLSDIQKANITEKIGGGFQIGPLLAALDDLTGKTSTYMGATQAMASAGNEAYARNTALNKTLAASINETTVNLQELANTLGEIGVTDSLKNILSFFSSLTTNIKDLLQGEGIGSDLANGIIKGLSGIITGPGFVIFGAIIAKLTYGLVAFGAESLKAFFGIGQAQKEINALASSLTNTLMTNENIHKAVLSLEGNHVAQAKLLGTILKQNNAEMQRFVEMGTRLAPGVASVVKGRGKSAAGGYMPAVAQENSDIQRGVGGANSSNKPVVIPNFAFGGGKVGTMVANDSEYVVNNYGGSDGSAIFNKDMISKIGLPSNAQKINSAGGFIPNFADKVSQPSVSFLRTQKLRETLAAKKSGGDQRVTLDASKFAFLVPVIKEKKDIKELSGSFKKGSATIPYSLTNLKIRGPLVPDAVDQTASPQDEKLQENITNSVISNSTNFANLLNPLRSSNVSQSEVAAKLKENKGSFGAIQAAVGSGFESAVMAALNITTANEKKGGDFDVRNADKHINTLFGLSNNVNLMDFKASDSKTGIDSFAKKIYNEIPSAITKKAGKAASGYIPNFANALNEAVSREIGTGVDPNKVYIDQNNSLKNSGNPMGLMVANRRDEPAGGWQGINRARKEGANAQMYGAAKGFIPNYAASGYGKRKFDPELAATAASGVAPAADKAAASLDKVADSADQTNKGQKDHLGTIFAVQLAMSGLSAAFGDATSGAGLVAKRFADAGSSITTAVFAMQALQKIGTEGSKLSGVMGKLGTVGIAATVAFEGFNLIRNVARDWTGATDQANKSTAAFKDQVDKAGISLSSLSSLEQFNRKKTAKDLIYNIQDKTGAAVGSKELQGRMAEFQYLSGLTGSGEDVQIKIKDILEKGGALTKYGTGKDTQTRIDEDKAAAAMADYLASDKGQKELNARKEEGKKITEATTAIETKKQGIALVSLNLAKEELKSALDIASAKYRLNDSLDKQLLGSEILKNLSEKETRDLKTKIDLRDADRKLADDARGLLKDQIDKLDGIKGKEAERNTLKAQYLKLTDEDYTKQETVRGLIKGVNELLTDGVDTSKEAKDLVEINLQKLFDTRDIEKDRLNINKQNTEEYNSQKNAIDLIAATMKAASSYKSFSSTMSSDIGIQSKNLEVGRLEDSKRGKSDEEIRSIEKTIAARKLEITQLEGSKRTTESITQAKSILEGSLPEAVDKQSRQVFSSLANSVDDAISIATRNLNKAKPEEKAAYTSAIFELQKLKETTEFQNKSAIELAQQQAGMAGQTQAVNDALVLFKNSLEGIPQKLADLSLERGVTTSGGRLREIDYESTTLSEVEKMKADKKTPEEIAAYQRERSVKGVGQKFSEAFSETEYDRANRFSDSLVSGAEKFRDTMIDGMSKAIEEGGSLGDILSGAALDFAREMTKTNMKNLFSSFMPSPRIGFASGGKITGGSGTKDDVPAMLMGGEYVMNKKSVSKYGTKFMEQLNSGTLSHFASGGAVGDPEKYKISSGGLGSSSQIMSSSPTQTGEGGFYMPGYYGEGTISGKKDLLSYASQAYTSGAKDIMTSGKNFAGISLEGESVALTNFGRTQGPMAQAIAESKGQSFDLYKQQIEQEAAIEKARKDAIKARQKALKTALITAVASAAISGALNVAKTGFQQGIANGGGFMGGVKGVGEKFGNVGSSLNSLFKGDMQSASQYSNMANTNFNATSGIPKGIIEGLTNNTSIGGFKATAYGLSSIDPTTALDQRKSDQGIKGYENFSQTIGSSGRKLIPGYSVASNYFPLGTMLNINGGVYRVDDTGGMSRDKVDFFSGDDKTLYKQFSNMGNLNIKKLATGGSVPQTSGIDTVPTMLSGGEFVMNAGATQRIGPANLNAMNSGTSDTGKDSKELNDKLISKLDELILASKESGKGVTVNVASNGKEETKPEGSSEQDKNLSRKIKEAVVKILQEEKRLGGVLRRS